MKYSPDCLFAKTVFGLFFLCICALSPVYAQQTVWWVGGGETNDWSDPDNWSTGEVPGESDTVRFGYGDDGNVANTPQVINVDAAYIVQEIQFSLEGNRSVTLNGAGSIQPTTAVIEQPNTAGASLTINTTIGIPSGNITLRNSSTALPLYIEGSGVLTPGNFVDKYGPGDLVLAGPLAGTTRVYAAGRIILAPTNPDLSLMSYVLRHNSNAETTRLIVAADARIYAMELSRLENGGMGLERDGEGDRVLRIDRTIGGKTTRVLRIIEGEEGEGHFTVRAHGMTGAAVDIAADATLEFYTGTVASNDRGIRLPSAALGPVTDVAIMGEGDVRLAMSANTTIFDVYRSLMHTGRTLIEQGIWQMQTTEIEVDEEPVIFTPTLSANSVVEIASTGELRLNGTNQTIGGLSGSTSQGTAGNVALGGGTLTIDSKESTVFGGQFTGDGEVIKTGYETLVLTGTQSFSGPITVAGGLLRIDGTLVNSPVTVTAGGVIGGTGTIGGTLTIGSEGAIAPGNSPGTLNVSGDLFFQAGSVVYFELGSGGNDLIALTGNGQTLVTGGPVYWVFTPTGDVDIGTAYTLIDWSLASGVDTLEFYLWDMVIGNPEWEGTFAFEGDKLTVTFDFVPVPEPAHVAALFGAVFLLLAVVRRRRA